MGSIPGRVKDFKKGTSGYLAWRASTGFSAKRVFTILYRHADNAFFSGLLQYWRLVETSKALLSVKNINHARF